MLGYGRGSDNGDTAWTSAQQAVVDRCVKGGLRNFYHCGYDWSFLRPVAALTLANNTQVLNLPDDYGGMDGQITVSLTTGMQWWPVDLMPIGTVNQMYARLPTTTGRPELCCEEPLKGVTAQHGQRMQLRFWPISNNDYTLKFQYYVNPDYLSTSQAYALGGAQHAETLLESCLAVAEKIADDLGTVHAAEFDKRLIVSKEIDRRNKPQKLGYNGDKTGYRLTPYERRSWTGITVGGVQY